MEKAKITKREAESMFSELISKIDTSEYLEWLLNVEWNYVKNIATENFVAPLQYFGGKNKLAKVIIPLLDYDKTVYVEPFFGSGAIFFKKPQHPIEYINDLDKNLYNLLDVLRQPENAVLLIHKLFFSNNSRELFRDCLRIIKDKDRFEKYNKVDIAYAFVYANIASISGIGSMTEGAIGNWSRPQNKRNLATGGAANSRIIRRAYLIPYYWHRLCVANIDCRNAFDVIKNYDGDDTMFYLDPPYVFDTREKNSRKVYNVEMENDEHEEFIDLVLGLKGKCLISGYDHPIYDRLVENGWRKVGIEVYSTFRAAGDSRSKRVEVLWANYDLDKQAEINYNRKNNKSLF